jgi:uroporphyrinogen-III synthase
VSDDKKGALRGRTVLVTRPADQASGLVRALRRHGARVVAIPAIRVAPPASFRALDKALRALQSYDCVVFTSRNAVDRFFARARALPLSVSRRPSYAIGEKTARELRRRGWRPLVARESRGEGVARMIPRPRGLRVLIPRAREAREALPVLLRRRGAVVDVVEAYRTLDDARGAGELRRLADSGALDAVTFTSVSTVRSVARQLGPARWRRLLKSAASASIGPITSRELRRRGAARVVEADAADETALAAALARRFRGGRGA